MLQGIWLSTACLGTLIVWATTRPGDGENRARPADVAALEPAIRPPEVLAVPAQPPVAEPIPRPAEPSVSPLNLPEPMPADPPLTPGADDENHPLNPDLALDEPPLNVPEQLSLRIQEYSQPRPVAVRLLLRQVAELSAVPVDLTEVEDEPWKLKLDQPVTLHLEQTTVGQLLEEILRLADLSYHHRDGIIFVKPQGTSEM